MSLLWAENFQSYGLDETYLLNGVYAQVSPGALLAATPDPSDSGNVLRMTDAVDTSQYRGTVLRFVLPDGSETTAGSGFRMWMEDLPVGSAVFLGWQVTDINNDTQVSFRVAPTGAIQAYRGNSGTGTLLGQTSGPVLVANAFNSILFKVI